MSQILRFRRLGAKRAAHTDVADIARLRRSTHALISLNKRFQSADRGRLANAAAMQAAGPFCGTARRHERGGCPRAATCTPGESFLEQATRGVVRHRELARCDALISDVRTSSTTWASLGMGRTPPWFGRLGEAETSPIQTTKGAVAPTTRRGRASSELPCRAAVPARPKARCAPARACAPRRRR